MLLLRGRIWTADAARPWAQALLITGGRIVAVGGLDELQRAYPGGHLFDLSDRLIIPGLWDAHIHFYYWCFAMRQVQLADCASLDEMRSRVELWATHNPGDPWILGWGWNENNWQQPALPSRYDLDPVTGSRPAVLWRADMHSAVANTAALEAAGLMEAGREIEGGVIDRDEDGTATGILREMAICQVRGLLPDPDEDRVVGVMKDGVGGLHRHGVTGICDQRMKGYTEGPKAFAAYARLEREGELALRVSCNVAAHDFDHAEALGLCTGFGSDRLRLGHLKFFLDGTLGSRTAWMLEPFEEAGTGDEGNRGLVVTAPEELAHEVRRAHRNGFAVSVHAIGTRAIRTCLDIFETLPGKPLAAPHRIEHVQFVMPDDLDRLARLNVTASVQPAHILDDMDTADAYLGARADCAYRLASLVRAGTLLACGSDAPVADFNPFYGIQAAVTRQRPGSEGEPWYPLERMTMDETLHGYTLGAARAAGWDDITGSLEPGKRADLVVLSRDLFEEPDQALNDPSPVLMTMFDGQIVYQADFPGGVR